MVGWRLSCPSLSPCKIRCRRVISLARAHEGGFAVAIHRRRSAGKGSSAPSSGSGDWQRRSPLDQRPRSDRSTALPSIGFLQLLSSFRQRVEVGADDRNGRAGGAERRHRRVEEDDAREQDDHPLEGVGDGVRHRVHFVEREHRDLVVRVEVQPGDDGLLEHLERRGGGGGGGEDRGRLGPFNDEGERQRPQEGHDRENAEEVLWSHVLSLRLVHRDAREDVSRGEGKVGEHRAPEGKPREAELRHRGQGDAGDDRDEREGCKRRDALAKKERGKAAREDRLRGLDDLCEGDSAGGGRDDRADVAERVAEGDRRESHHRTP
mmetsp:Transcript_42774/g.106484  ORF Transcript_42774/g.106484 Transcript_42774/m.106484 type:complete len:321 (+) Transcript_42774:158-1120(+)